MEYPYLTCATTLPESIPYPLFLQQTQLSNSARLMYCLLLGKALDAKAASSEDKLCVSLSFGELSLLLSRSRSSVKRLLRELEESGLLERIHRHTQAEAEITCYFHCPL